MDTPALELLSAFIDGEEVDSRELARALTEPGAREALREFALLRAEVDEDDTRPGPGFYERMQSTLANEDAPRRRWRWSWVPVPAPALAGLLVAVLALGLWVTSMIQKPEPAAALPPDPDRVVRFETGIDWNPS